MTEPYAILTTLLVGVSLTAVVLAVLLVAAIAALWRCRRQRDGHRARADRQRVRIRHQRARIAQYLAELDAVTEATRPRQVAAWALDQRVPVIPGMLTDPDQAVEAALVCLTEGELLERYDLDGHLTLDEQARDKLRQLTSEQLIDALIVTLSGEAIERADAVEQVPADAGSLLDGGDR